MKPLRYPNAVPQKLPVKQKREEVEAQRKAKQLAAQKEQAGRFTQQVMTEYQTTVDPATGRIESGGTSRNAGTAEESGAG